MKLRWLIPIAILFPLQMHASEPAVNARVATVTIGPNEITTLHLRSDFESSIRMPEEITSVILGSPGSFKAEHSEGEPEYVYVKPITKEPAQSNLLIATKSGQHVSLELVSDGAVANGVTPPVDFLIEYRAARSFLIGSGLVSMISPWPFEKASRPVARPIHETSTSAVPSALDVEFEQQQRINAPAGRRI